MVRPCFLMLDPDHAGSISSRKLVIETAKHNVITAYSAPELLETLDAYPRVSAVILNANVREIPCEELAKSIKQKNPALPVISIAPTDGPPCQDIDHTVGNYSPEGLLNVLKTIEPAKSATILRHEEEISVGEPNPQ